jgi:hypothetical protein
VIRAAEGGLQHDGLTVVERIKHSEGGVCNRAADEGAPHGQLAEEGRGLFHREQDATNAAAAVIKGSTNSINDARSTKGNADARCACR